ncbi:hypothetical protein GCM10022395_12300 [Snuella lapsa]|uniref:Uncharacterized protein n=1 Tax=Snuella lapsa TaxID=870481 RepID=A0ABP6XCX0_9FLAO
MPKCGAKFNLNVFVDAVFDGLGLPMACRLEIPIPNREAEAVVFFMNDRLFTMFSF